MEVLVTVFFWESNFGQQWCSTGKYFLKKKHNCMGTFQFMQGKQYPCPLEEGKRVTESTNPYV